MRAPKVPLISLGADHAPSAHELQAALARVLDSSKFVLGTEVEAFEREIAAYLAVHHAIGVSSGTDALIVALSALGIGAGDEVVTTPFSFVATAEAIVRVGARPRFVDIDPDTLLIDLAKIAERPRSVLPVHLFGHPVPLDALSLDGIAVIEDAAQAIGARIGDKSVGALGRFGCFSFFPTKPLAALGDAGLVVTNDAELAARARRLRQHGADQKNHYLEIGGNFRLDALQAAFLRVKLPRLEASLEARRTHARAYSEALADIAAVRVPNTHPDSQSAWAHYVIRVDSKRRDPLRAHLAELGVETAIYYPTPLHLQPAFAFLGHRPGDFPEAERAASEVLALPLFPSLSEPDRSRVIDGIRGFFARI